jgi:hypothetical protein
MPLFAISTGAEDVLDLLGQQLGWGFESASFLWGLQSLTETFYCSILLTNLNIENLARMHSDSKDFNRICWSHDPEKPCRRNSRCSQGLDNE